MKTYPSIPSSFGASFREVKGSHVFDKLDGSNLRFSWVRKRGWVKFGTRNCLLDLSHPVFGEAIPIFMGSLADEIEKVARDQRWERLVAFAEFWGDNSFAGYHENEPHRLTLFDIAPYKKGVLGPVKFLNLFDHLPIPNYLGVHNWSRQFVEDVRTGRVEGVTFEGVVGKAGEGHELVMVKAKTQRWIDRVKGKFGDVEGTKIINS